MFGFLTEQVALWSEQSIRPLCKSSRWYRLRYQQLFINSRL